MKLTGFLAAIAIVTASLSANAISLRYKFKVFSSGPSIYACNAGILAQTGNRRVCYFQGTNQTCTPDDCSTTAGNCNSSCVCSSLNGGDYLMNYGVVTSQDWKDHGDTSVTGRVVDQKFQSTNLGNWAIALTEQDSWKKRITDLSFNLGSELYSARYFVDICYRGPQIEYNEDNASANFRLVAQSFATDFLANGPNGGENNRDGLEIPGTVDGRKYTELSDLKVQAFVTCDLQGVGSFQKARNNSDRYNTTDNEAGFVLGSNGLPTGSTEAGSYWVSPEMNVSGAVANLLDAWVAQGTKAPRFCKVRYVFSETNFLATLPNLRKWQRHGAEMCTYTDITEAALENGLQ